MILPLSGRWPSEVLAPECDTYEETSEDPQTEEGLEAPPLEVGGE